MNVLMVEDQSPDAARAADSLRIAGISVRCCRDEKDGFACHALLGGLCPLETGPVDAAVAVRSGGDQITTFGTHSGEAPSLAEEGIVCAIRRHVPLVMVCDSGDPYGGPFDPWIEGACVHDEVADVVQGVVEEPSDAYGDIATKALIAALDLYGMGDAGAQVDVRRRGGRLAAAVRLPEGIPTEIRDGCAVKIHDALHAFDPWIPTVDVRIEMGSPSH